MASAVLKSCFLYGFEDLRNDTIRCQTQPRLRHAVFKCAQNVTYSGDVMKLVMLNFLIMFDVVFIFFLFLIAVTCVMNYMPRRRRQQPSAEEVCDDVIPPPPLFAGDDDELPSTSRDTYVVIPPPLDSARVKDGCPIHVV